MNRDDQHQQSAEHKEHQRKVTEVPNSFYIFIPLCHDLCGHLPALFEISETVSPVNVGKYLRNC